MVMIFLNQNILGATYCNLSPSVKEEPLLAILQQMENGPFFKIFDEQIERQKLNFHLCFQKHPQHWASILRNKQDRKEMKWHRDIEKGNGKVLNEKLGHLVQKRLIFNIYIYQIFQKELLMDVFIYNTCP